jgi:hypothetical protein
VTDPRAFLAVDLGAATTSAALIGRLAHHWRLVGSLALPAPGDVDAMGTELVRRVFAADPGSAPRSAWRRTTTSSSRRRSPPTCRG